MNVKEFNLDEMEIHSSLYEEGMLCLLHTILFVRAPGSLHPKDAHTKLGITYAKCGVDDVDVTVNMTLESLKKSLIPVGPTLAKGVIILSFFEKREVNNFFGIMKTQEKVHFERWKIPILVNQDALPRTVDEASDLSRARVYDSARQQIKQRMFNIFEIVNTNVDHVPPTSLYEFELEAVGLAGERRDSLVTRLINSPAIGI